jgi:hypothetical protein
MQTPEANYMNLICPNKLPQRAGSIMLDFIVQVSRYAAVLILHEIPHTG